MLKKNTEWRAVVSKHAFKRQGIFMKEAAFQVKLVGFVGIPEKRYSRQRKLKVIGKFI